MDSVLDLYKTKLKEALTLVADLTIDQQKIDAVNYWNELAEQLQEIIHRSGLANTDDHELNTNINNSNYQHHSLSVPSSSLSSSTGQIFHGIADQPDAGTTIYSHTPLECRSTPILQQDLSHEPDHLQQSRLIVTNQPRNTITTLDHEVNNVTTSQQIEVQIAQEHVPDYMIPQLEQTHRLGLHHNQHHLDNLSTKSALNEPYLTQPGIEHNCSSLKQFNDNKQPPCQSTLTQLSSANMSNHQNQISINNIVPADYVMSNDVSPTNAIGSMNSSSPINSIQCSDNTTNVNMAQSCDPFAEIKPFNMINQVPQDSNYGSGVNNNFMNEHACQVCGKSGFSTKGNLKRHLRAHSGEKPFKCEYCESCFTEKKSLKIHVRRHTGEKPYKCQICGKPFSQTGVLQSHMALHYNERKFDCNKCGKAFRQRSQLKLHLMRHDGVKRLECSTCRAKFLTKGDLERHCRIHTGERPYLCDLCGKTFTRQQSLNEHLNRHTGRKPYDCKYCDKSFSEMSACYKHAKTHKKDDLKDQSEQVQQLDEQPTLNNN